MFDFHEKRKIRSILYSKPVIFILFTISALMSISVYNRYSVAEDIQSKLDERRTELETLKNRATMLESKVQYLNNDRGVEEELRNRFDVAKEGEQVVILVDTKNEVKKEKELPKAVTEGVEAPTVAQESLLERLFKFW